MTGHSISTTQQISSASGGTGPSGRDSSGSGPGRRSLAVLVIAGVAALLLTLALIPGLLPGLLPETAGQHDMSDHDMTDHGMQMAADAAQRGSKPGDAAGRPASISVTTVSSETLAHVPGKTVTVQVLEFQPGAIASEHHHAGSVTVYVLSGTIRSQLAGQPAMTYTEGQTFFEPIGAVHLFAENPSKTETARIMAVHVADEGAQLTTYH